MSLPPNPEAHDEVDDRYRRASALDTSRPGEAVRRRVLENAAQLAAERKSRWRSASAGVASAPQRAPRWWRTAGLFGTLAAAVIAGVMIAPRFLVSPVAPPSRPLTPPPILTELQKDEVAGHSLASRAPAPESAHARVPRPAQEHAEAYLSEAPAAASPAAGAANSKAAAAADSRAAAAADAQAAAASGMAANTTGDTRQEVIVTAAPRAAPAPPAANVTDAGAALRQAAETGDLGTLDRLLATPSDINARDAAGRTPLMLAILRGQTDAVSALLAYGADPNAADSHGSTPLQAARAAGRPAIVAALQRYGAR